MKTRDIVKEIRKEAGNVTAVADTLGISRMTMYRKIRKSPVLQAAIEEARESSLDKVEHVLHQKAADGEPWAVCFYLKTQGKRRGYVERQEVTGAEGGRLIIEVTSDRNAIEGSSEPIQVSPVQGQVPGVHRRDRIGEDVGRVSEGADKV